MQQGERISSPIPQIGVDANAQTDHKTNYFGPSDASGWHALLKAAYYTLAVEDDLPGLPLTRMIAF